MVRYTSDLNQPQSMNNKTVAMQKLQEKNTNPNLLHNCKIATFKGNDAATFWKNTDQPQRKQENTNFVNA